MILLNQLNKYYKLTQIFYTIDNIKNLLYIYLPDQIFILKSIKMINKGSFGMIYQYYDINNNESIAI